MAEFSAPTGIIACDFLVVETVLLKRLYVLVFIEHGTRRLHTAAYDAVCDYRKRAAAPS
ncbi:MAG TPA: hypothetical protein VGD53_09020 [Actinoallomurus sp.]